MLHVFEFYRHLSYIYGAILFENKSGMALKINLEICICKHTIIAIWILYEIATPLNNKQMDY